MFQSKEKPFSIGQCRNREDHSDTSVPYHIDLIQIMVLTIIGKDIFAYQSVRHSWKIENLKQKKMMKIF